MAQRRCGEISKKQNNKESLFYEEQQNYGHVYWVIGNRRMKNSCLKKKQKWNVLMKKKQHWNMSRKKKKQQQVEWKEKEVTMECIKEETKVEWCKKKKQLRSSSKKKNKQEAKWKEEDSEMERRRCS